MFTPKKGVVVTGAAGFIGSSFMPQLLSQFPGVPVYALDKLTYAGFRNNLSEFETLIENRDCGSEFKQLDITDYAALKDFFGKHSVDTIIHFAAETHVDRSLNTPELFFHTNVIGTTTLLEIAREFAVARFVHISTDEVYGSTPEGEEFDESANLNPSSPYSASKAASDLAVLSYVHSYNLPALIVRGTNNYGPRQYPEKLIPFFISRALSGKSLPLYGDGEHERDWIHTDDFGRGILCALGSGSDGEIYNISANQRLTNNSLTDILQTILSGEGIAEVPVEFTADRPGHDLCYRVNCAKIQALGFAPQISFGEGFAETVRWYITHRERLLNIASENQSSL